MPDFSAQDKFNPDKGYSQVRFGGGAGAKLLEVELNEMQRIQAEARADIIRMSTHSGVLDYDKTVAIGYGTDSTTKGKVRVPSTSDNDFNAFRLNETSLLINGYKITAPNPNYITLPAPPTFGSRDDLVFLEAWFEEIPGSSATVSKYGGEASGTINSDIVDSRIGLETSRRIQLKWRIRTVAGVDFTLLSMDGLAISNGWFPAVTDASKRIMAQGGNTSPVSDTTQYIGAFKSPKIYDSNTTPPAGSFDDKGLYYAGNGTQTAKDLLKTADGYVYAIPLFRVKRRNNGGYRPDNVSGARDYYSVSMPTTTIDVIGQVQDVTLTQADIDKIKVGDILSYNGNQYAYRAVNKNGTTLTIQVVIPRPTGTLASTFYLQSDRPDGKYSNIIHQDDIIDLRHKVSLTGFNYDQLLEQNFDALIRGELSTKDTKTTNKERFALHRAPYGAVAQTIPVSVKGDDGTDRVLVNKLPNPTGDATKNYLFVPDVTQQHVGRMYNGSTAYNDVSKIALPSGALSYAVTSDFRNKVVGSTTVNPHRAGASGVSSLQAYSALLSEHSANDYTNLATQNGVSKTSTVNTSGQFVQFLYQFDIIRILTDKFGSGIWQGKTALADKVTIAKSIITKIICNWWGYGSSPTGNKASLSVWAFDSSVWVSGGSHTSGSIAKISPTIASPSTRIDANGYIYFTAYSDPSDGVTASTLNADFIELEVYTSANVAPINDRLYEVVQTDADKIGVDSGFTGYSALDKKFPWLQTYPNIVENLFNGFKPSEPNTYYAINSATGTANTSWNTDMFTVKPNTAYTIRGNNNIHLNQYDSSNNLVASTWINPSSASTPVTITTTSTTAYMKVSVDTTSGDIKTVEVVEGNKINPVVVPYGRWNLPYDVASGQTALRLEPFQQNRKVVTDRQYSDTITEVVDNLRTPQKHIKVTQATEGVWAVNDTIAISSDDGVITGVIDSDTALAKVISSIVNTNTVTLDDVSKLAVNDTVIFTDSNFALLHTRTITAIDTTNKVITVDSNITANTLAFLLETTASSSSPVTTATGLVGTWSNLGTKTATFTITTAPTTNTDKIKVSYSVSYPAGKGIQQIPDMYQINVNGQKHVKSSDGTILIKANFDGKVSGSTDKVGHSAKANSAYTSLQTPTGSWGENTQGSYDQIRALDGSTRGTGSSTNLVMAQHLFQFDIIRAITDRLGNEVFADCVMLADKVAKAKTIVTKIVANWYGYGSSPTGNKATIAPWRSDNSSWGTSINNTANVVTKTSFTNLETNSVNKISNTIDANGYLYVISYADPSDGVTASTINTDYVELEITLNPAETGYDVFYPENPFPVRVEALYQEGENMLPPFNEVIVGNSLVTVTPVDKYSLTGVSSSVNNAIYFSIPVVPYTQYSVMCNHNGKIGVYTDDGLTAIAAYTANTSITFNSGNNSRLRLYLRFENIGTTYSYSNWMLTPGTKAYPFVPQTRIRKSKRTLDFLGKVAGSTWENPHKFRQTSYNTFDAPSVMMGGAERSQSDYDQITKLEGTLVSRTTATTGYYSQFLYEFDLSHLGLSLSELKRLLRKLTVNWTGYGQGDNAGAVGYGATLKAWTTNGNAWSSAFSASNTGSSPSLVTKYDTNNAYITNDQKVYILVYTTYPASATNASTLYTDYINLVVELSEEVDYVKGNVVKVMKETKEVKTDYVPLSYTNGVYDVIELFYGYQPYQGQGLTSAHTVLTKPDIAWLTTIGTGKERPSTITQGSYFSPIVNLPLGNAVSGDFSFIDSTLTLSGQFKQAGGSYFDDLFLAKIPTDEFLHSSSVGYKGIRIGDIAVLSGSGKRGLNNNSLRNYRRIRPQITTSGTYLIVIPYLAMIDGEVFLVVLTNSSYVTNQVFVVDGQTYCAADIFRINGRPMMKGGI